MKKFSEALKGERIELRLLKPTFEMAKQKYKVISENREHILPWMGWASKERTGTVEDIFKYLLFSEEEQKKGNLFDYNLFLENEFIGIVGVMDVSEKNKSGEISCWIKKSVSGKGYVAEALKMIENEMFSGDGLNRLMFRCDEDNITSANVAKKAGYIFEGKTRQVGYSKLRKKFTNDFVFSKLKSEWDERKKINNKRKRN